MNPSLTVDAAPRRDIEEILPKVELVAEDGEPLESDWHRMAMNLLIEIVCWFLRERSDFYVGGNMFIYFSEKRARDQDFRGPDFFFVWGASRYPPRDYWAVWLEDGRYPDAIIELMSPKTMREDLTTKKDIYEKTFRTPDYFCYDPVTRELRGWRLSDQKYVPIEPDVNGRLECRSLGLWLGTWKGKHLGFDTVWLRFFDTEGSLVPTFAEAERQRAEAAEAELARLRAQAETSKTGGDGNT
jgi:Uma2 family endonuclease